MLGLRVVHTGAVIASLSREILVTSTRGAVKRITVEERPVPTPQISLLLWEFYTLSDLIEAGGELGTQMAALLPYIWQGKREHLRGAVVPLVGGPLLVVPLGFFSGGLN